MIVDISFNSINTHDTIPNVIDIKVMNGKYYFINSSGTKTVAHNAKDIKDVRIIPEDNDSLSRIIRNKTIKNKEEEKLNVKG